MDFEQILIIVVLCLILAGSFRANGARVISNEGDLGLERQLRLINKPPVKSIQTEFGHIVDCIDINKQLSFDHPLLKDHKIQKIPSFLQEKTKNEDLSQDRLSMIGLAKGACPLGTVPIRRTTKEDLIASKLLLNNMHPQAAPTPNAYRAFLQMEKTKYYTGVEGNITVYNPQVKEGQTYAQIFVYNGDDAEYFNLVAAGWMVGQALYHDGASHIFAVYTNDNFKQAGCLNYVCPGFVQKHTSIYLGAGIYNISVPGGNLFQLPISLQQDSDYNWWLSVVGNVVGYYPKEIVFNLMQAQGIGWGGVAVGNPKGNIAPPMESGSFPDGVDNSFTNIQYRTDQVNTTTVPESSHYRIILDNPKCYDLKYDGYKNQQLGFAFQIGGPGGPCAN